MASICYQMETFVLLSPSESHLNVVLYDSIVCVHFSSDLHFHVAFVETLGVRMDRQRRKNGQLFFSFLSFEKEDRRHSMKNRLKDNALETTSLCLLFLYCR